MVLSYTTPIRLISDSEPEESVPNVAFGLPGEPVVDFDLPHELEAGQPPEARGLARDEVRLMVSYRSDNHIVHTNFRQIGDFLNPGDLLVVNTSGTMNAALNATRNDGMPLELHLSTHLPADLWIVEVRTPAGKTTRPFFDVKAGETLQLADGAEATLHMPYLHNRETAGPLYSTYGIPQPTVAHQRLWIATLKLPYPLPLYLERHGFPIRYSYVQEQWPLEYYQSVYVTERGSAEMPSAGRAFTPELITNLVAHGVQVAPLLLHTGVASLEDYEPPYEEFYRVPPETARLVNAARGAGKRVVAIGTTVVRALETVTDTDGIAHPGEGWTRLIVTPERGMHAANALLTGFHEPKATHMFMLEALANREHLRISYQEALRAGYLWHEFGDLHLILP
ncbi:MAG TPA: S-adenosylmethionine:tRNA ribosyltransferase-isomerase [Ktedonosporobacter sp.]|nr:S-adenosylmethionine:tRNA ribosyltransferase-isomerase [Ktedonosporobacter sp.]